MTNASEISVSIIYGLSFIFQFVFVPCHSVFDFTSYVPTIVCREALTLTKRFSEDFSNYLCNTLRAEEKMA